MNIEQLLAQLRHGDRHVRDEAFEEIAASREPALLDPLAERARPEDPYMEVLFCRYLENLPAATSLPHLRRLLDSPNAPTRAHALQNLDRIPVEESLETFVELLDSPRADVRLHILRELGRHRRTAAIYAIVPLLANADPELATEAFAALRHIDAPRALKHLLPHLRAGEPWRRIAALEALGGMGCFARWRHLLPCLRDADAGVRRAAVLNLSRKAGARANRHLLPVLVAESDEEVAKLVLSRLAITPDERVVRVLIELAATHANPQIRRAAGWIIEELEENLLRRTMLAALPATGEEVQAYILTKMGMRQLPRCGPVISSYVDEARLPRVRYAALEGLGFLGRREFLPAVVPLLASADPMEAYVATLAAVQMVDRLGDCPELLELLSSPDAGNVALKQVVLEFMIDSIAWQHDDPHLFSMLIGNLQAENENIAYLSAILLGKFRGRRELVPPLLATALDDPNPNIRQVAGTSLDTVLDGDLAPLLIEIERRELPERRLRQYALLLSCMHWKAASARRALAAFAGLPIPADDGELGAALERIARSVYAADPAASRACFQAYRGLPDWRRALGLAWLGSLGELQHSQDRADWRLLLDDAEMAADAVERAVELGAAWAAADLVDRALSHPDPSFTPQLRTAARQLLGL